MSNNGTKEDPDQVPRGPQTSVFQIGLKHLIAPSFRAHHSGLARVSISIQSGSKSGRKIWTFLKHMQGKCMEFGPRDEL